MSLRLAEIIPNTRPYGFVCWSAAAKIDWAQTAVAASGRANWLSDWYPTEIGRALGLSRWAVIRALAKNPGTRRAERPAPPAPTTVPSGGVVVES